MNFGSEHRSGYLTSVRSLYLSRLLDSRAPNIATIGTLCLVVLGAVGYVLSDKGFEVPAFPVLSFLIFLLLSVLCLLTMSLHLCRICKQALTYFPVSFPLARCFPSWGSALATPPGTPAPARDDAAGRAGGGRCGTWGGCSRTGRPTRRTRS